MVRNSILILTLMCVLVACTSTPNGYIMTTPNRGYPLPDSNSLKKSLPIIENAFTSIDKDVNKSILSIDSDPTWDSGDTIVTGSIVWQNPSSPSIWSLAGISEASVQDLGIANIEDDYVALFGQAKTDQSFVDGDVLYLSHLTPGLATTTETGILIGVYVNNRIIFRPKEIVAVVPPETVATPSNPNLLINSEGIANQEHYVDGDLTTEKQYIFDLWGVDRTGTGNCLKVTRVVRGFYIDNNVVSPSTAWMLQGNDDLEVLAEGSTLTVSGIIESMSELSTVSLNGLGCDFDITETGEFSHTFFKDSLNTTIYNTPFIKIVVEPGKTLTIKNFKVEENDTKTTYNSPKVTDNQLRCYRYYRLLLARNHEPEVGTTPIRVFRGELEKYSVTVNEYGRFVAFLPLSVDMRMVIATGQPPKLKLVGKPNETSGSDNLTILSVSGETSYFEVPIDNFYVIGYLDAMYLTISSPTIPITTTGLGIESAIAYYHSAGYDSPLVLAIDAREPL